MVRWLVVAVLLLLAIGVQAQQTGPQDACRQLKANPGNTRQNYTVGTSAVTVVAANPKLCDAIIQNLSNTQSILCAAIPDGDPTGTAGFELRPLGIHSLELAAQRGYKCIRKSTATADVEVSVAEVEP